MGGRFFELELEVDEGPIRHALYTFGYDRRHGEFIVTAMDDTGTYWVTARGDRTGDVVAMRGSDDDPVMSSLGFTKEFVIALHLVTDDRVIIETRFVDTRTPERTEQPFIAFHLRRGSRDAPG